MQASDWCCMRSTLLRFSRHLRVIGYSFPFHVHILCIWYGTTLANTAVLYMHVHIICLPVCGNTWYYMVTVITLTMGTLYPWKCYYNTITLRRVFFIVECGISCFLCAMHVLEVRASASSPRLPLCYISFLSRPLLLSWPMEKNRVINQSLNHSLAQPI